MFTDFNGRHGFVSVMQNNACTCLVLSDFECIEVYAWRCDPDS